MGITIDNSIRLIEDYHEWEKEWGLDGSSMDDATNKLIEVAKKYQKIEQILDDCDLEAWEVLERIRKVVEDGECK